MRKLFALAGLAVALDAPRAQQTPAPPPAWQQGRPAEMAGSKMAPHKGKDTETPPGEIPLDRLKVPEGFKVELWAHGLPGARAMARGEKGKIYVGTRQIGRVYEVSDRGGERAVRIVAEKLKQPAGVAFRNGALYVFSIDKVLRYDGIEDRPDVQPADLTSRFQLPPEGHHQWKYVAFGPDGKLYVPFGAPCNICQPPEGYAQIRRYKPDGSGMELVARGLRNSLGFDWHPKTRELWVTENGRDWMGDDAPEEELNRVTRKGEDFGFPYCHANGIPDPEIKKKDPCKGVTLPVALLGPHAAALGMIFYTGSLFPPEYRDAILVARRGSWNRSKLSGYDVVMVKADADGKNARVTPFMTGFMDPEANAFWGRPTYLLQLPDGSLLVADEQNGAIYRVTYGKPSAT
jgi:glucose/arabinose dehydrogenase